MDKSAPVRIDTHLSDNSSIIRRGIDKYVYMNMEKVANFNSDFELIVKVIEKLGIKLTGYENKISPESISTTINLEYYGYDPKDFKQEILRGILKELFGEKDEPQTGN